MYTWHDFNIDTQIHGHFVHILAHSISKFFISPYLIYQVGPQPRVKLKKSANGFIKLFKYFMGIKYFSG